MDLLSHTSSSPSSVCVCVSFPAESAVVQQDSKQVQVDLQDLGYETCGRSENEAERDDTSSPGNTHTNTQIWYTHTNEPPHTYIVPVS